MVEDCLLNYLPPSTLSFHRSTINCGFFKSLKHSASVNVGKHSNGGLGGFGLGSASPTAPLAKDKEASPRKSSSGAGASTPVLSTTTNGDSHLPLPPLPPLPPVPAKEKEKDKLSGWFSSARKSVKRRSRNKSKEKDDSSRAGTSSVASIVSEKESSHGSTSKTPLLDTNGYGGWPASNGWVGVEGGSSGPGSSSGALVPGSQHFNEARRASDSLQAPETVRGTSLTPRPTPTVDPLLANGISIPPDMGVGSSDHLPRPESPSTPRADGVLPIPRTATKSPSPRTPNGSMPPSPGLQRTGRYAPRKSLTMDQTTPSPPAPFAVGVSPIPREGKDENGSNVLKRASRKMSLTSGSIRMSGFGWHKDKDKDRS
ncbi:hypothetical protein FRB90_001053 [Tulasnella sp. 427]|nr:hypothetical protein FRB90_001053 [Tulasnella sp. 427]